MVSSETISLVSIALSIISTGIAVAGYRHAKRIQDYDYTTRLQLEEEQIRGGGFGPDDAFGYTVQLVNAGLKPAQIDHVYLDYGGEAEGTYYAYHFEGRFHLPPAGKRRLRFVVSKKQYDEILKEFSLEECLYRLRICFTNSGGTSVEVTRKLLSTGPGRVTVYAQGGDALT